MQDIVESILDISRIIDGFIDFEDKYFQTSNRLGSNEEVKAYFPDTNTLQEVMRRIDLLRSRKRKRDVGISTQQSLTAATSSSNIDARSISDQYIFDLRHKMHFFTSRAFHVGLMDFQNQQHYISVVEDMLEFLFKEPPLPLFKHGELRSSCMTGAEATKEEPRYLVVSSGCVVCILDLQQSKEEQRSDDQFLAIPKRATLKLIDKQLPVSVGLFKVGSDAYIAGGHEFSRHEDGENSSSDCKLYKRLWVRGCFKGTSSATYRLNVDKEEDGKMTLSPLICDGMRLLSPKFWPVVEEIGEELHVFVSAPSNVGASADESWIFSHEVLGRELVWTTEQGFIYSHVVVGHRIYAVAGKKNLLYENKKWQVHDRVYEWTRELGAAGAKTVWDILEHGNASCVGKAGANSEELYVIIVVVRNCFATIHINEDDDDDYYFPRTTGSYAYLVTLNGEVVCFQDLDHLFLTTKLEPYDMVQASVIKAGTDGWAAIVIGKALVDEKQLVAFNRECLFICMFTVKDCIRVVSDSFRKRADKYLEDRGLVMDANFVRVDVKARYIYKTNAAFDDDSDLADFVGLQACFLDSI